MAVWNGSTSVVGTVNAVGTGYGIKAGNTTATVNAGTIDCGTTTGISLEGATFSGYAGDNKQVRPGDQVAANGSGVTVYFKAARNWGGN